MIFSLSIRKLLIYENSLWIYDNYFYKQMLFLYYNNKRYYQWKKIYMQNDPGAYLSNL